MSEFRLAVDVQPQLVVDRLAVGPRRDGPPSGREVDPPEVFAPPVAVLVIRALAGAVASVDEVLTARFGDDHEQSGSAPGAADVVQNGEVLRERSGVNLVEGLRIGA